MRHGSLALPLAAAAALLALAGCGGTSGSSPSTSFPIGGTTPIVTTGSGTTTTTTIPTTTAAPAVALTATPGSGGGCVTLTWTASNLASPTFDVLRVSGNGTTTVASGLTGTRFVDVGLARDTAFGYQVVARVGGSVQATSGTMAATTFGPTAAGFGDPPSPAAGPDALFQGGVFALVTSQSSTAASANYFTLTLTLNKTASAGDLQAVRYQGTTYDEGNTAGFAKGVSVNGSQIMFDSRAAGITLDAQYAPVVQGGYYSFTVTVDGAAVEITAPAGTAGSQPNVSTFTDAAGRVFSLGISSST